MTDLARYREALHMLTLKAQMMLRKLSNLWMVAG